MSSTPFDTLNMVERLISAGVPPEQAKMQAMLLAEVIRAEDASIVERFSRKTEVALELSGVKAEISALRSEVKQSISESKADLIRWVVSVGILQMALVAGLVMKLIP